ncbi:MAG: hypothetical protein ABI856_19485 [Nitrospira sp.]
MKTRSAKPRAADAVKAPLPTKAHSLRRGNQALAAPLIVPADLDEAVSRARASMREKSMTPKALPRKSTRLTNLL